MYLLTSAGSGAGRFFAVLGGMVYIFWNKTKQNRPGFSSIHCIVIFIITVQSSSSLYNQHQDGSLIIKWMLQILQHPLFFSAFSSLVFHKQGL